MKISLTIPNNHRVAALLQPWQDEVGGRQIAEVAALADRLGFARLTVGEHFAIPAGHVAVSGSHYLQPATALGFLAGHTSRIRLGSNVSVLALQHPVVQAKQWAVLDWLSGGRTDLVVGTGWLAGEFAALGIDFASRGRRTDEYVEAMLALWTGDRASYHGEFVDFTDLVADPKPIQAGGVPLWFAGDVAATVRRVARWGSGWSPFQTPPARIPDVIDRITTHPDYHGRPIGVFLTLAALQLDDDHQPRAGAEPDDWNAEQLVDTIGRMGELGVTDIAPPLPRLSGYAEYLERLHWLGEEVVPRVRTP